TRRYIARDRFGTSSRLPAFKPETIVARCRCIGSDHDRILGYRCVIRKSTKMDTRGGSVTQIPIVLFPLGGLNGLIGSCWDLRDASGTQRVCVQRAATYLP